MLPQAAVFEEVSDLVQSALDGYKVCLFSYGQTGAGKTHTMQGSRSFEGQGIIPRSIAKVRPDVMHSRAGAHPEGHIVAQSVLLQIAWHGLTVPCPPSALPLWSSDCSPAPPYLLLSPFLSTSVNLVCLPPTRPKPTRLPRHATPHSSMSLCPLQILESVAKLREQGWEYQLHAAFIEVYNEQLRDLLADTAPGRREAGKIQGGSATEGLPVWF